MSLIESLFSTHLQIHASLMLIVLAENCVLRNTALKFAGLAPTFVLILMLMMMLTANVDVNRNVMVMY